MIKLQQVKVLILNNPKIDQNIDLDGSNGFLLVTNNGWIWNANDPGCHTRGWDYDDALTITDVKRAISSIAPCLGGCGSDQCDALALIEGAAK